MTRQNEHKRHKFGQMPGDLSKRTKIAMLEGPAGLVDDPHARAFRRMLKKESKAKQRHRDKKEVIV